MTAGAVVVDLPRALAGYVDRWRSIDPAVRAEILADQANRRRGGDAA